MHPQILGAPCPWWQVGLILTRPQDPKPGIQFRFGALLRMLLTTANRPRRVTTSPQFHPLLAVRRSMFWSGAELVLGTHICSQASP